MTQPSAGQRYSLWLMPEGLARRRLEQLLRELSARYRGPEFLPHVTLLGSCVGERDEMIRRSSLVANLLTPFTIRLGKIDFRDEYFRCLFVHAGPLVPMRNAYHGACRKFNRTPDPDFMPHLSLLYGNFPQALKEEAMAELGPRLNVQFKVRNLYLFQTHGEVRNWHEVVRFPIN
jgi:2'-5' RNA ligase